MDAATLSQNHPSGSFADLLVKIQQPIPTENQPTFTPWTEQDLDDLKHYIDLGKTRVEIANLLGRTPDAVAYRARKLGLSLKKPLSDKQKDYIAMNYPLYGASHISKQLKVSKDRVRREARRLGLSYKTREDYNPPIPKSLLPYHMVKRVSLLDRGDPNSKNKVDDCVIVLYDKVGPGAPMMAMHLDDLLVALEQHFGRRAGVATGALLSGYKA